MQDEGGKGFVLGDLDVKPLRSYHVKRRRVIVLLYNWGDNTRNFNKIL